MPNQIRAVSSVQELLLGLVSPHRSCEPEPPMNNYCTYTAINHSKHEDKNSRYHQSKQSTNDLWLLLAIYSHLFSLLTRAGRSNQQVLGPGVEKSCGYFVFQWSRYREVEVICGNVIFKPHLMAKISLLQWKKKLQLKSTTFLH